MGDGACFTIDDVTRLTGVSRRTVRFYVTSKLIPPPDGRGAGLHYWQEHVDGILRVLHAKERGASLAAIAGAVDERSQRAITDAEHEHSQRAIVEPDGGHPTPPVAVDHGVPARAAAVSPEPALVIAETASLKAQMERIRTLRQLGRCTVENRTGNIVVISDGKYMGEALILHPGGRAEVVAVTLSLAKAEVQGLVAVTPL